MLSTPPAAFSRKIVVESLSHAFDIDGRSVPVLTDVSLEVAQGEFLAIVGPSGCGKSTLLNIVSGLFPPTTGRVTVDGVPVEGINPRIGYMFARDALLPWRTSLANVAFGPELAGEPADRREARARDLLRLTGLAGFEGSYPSQLSQGMRQRVSLARTLARNPDILLMDEPFGALDTQTRLLMQEELLRIWEANQKTILFVTHSVDEAVVLSDRIVVMTARPGTVKKSVEVPFGRPRVVEDLMHDVAAMELRTDLWHLVKAEVLKGGPR